MKRFLILLIIATLISPISAFALYKQKVDPDLHNYDWTNVDATDLKVGSITQAWDADLDDLADGTLSKSKVEDSGNWDTAYGWGDWNGNIDVSDDTNLAIIANELLLTDDTLSLEDPITKDLIQFHFADGNIYVIGPNDAESPCTGYMLKKTGVTKPDFKMGFVGGNNEQRVDVGWNDDGAPGPYISFYDEDHATSPSAMIMVYGSGNDSAEGYWQLLLQEENGGDQYYEIFRADSAKDLHLQPDNHGDVIYFYDEDVGDASNGSIVTGHRKANEGDKYWQMLIDQYQGFQIHTDCTMFWLQAGAYDVLDQVIATKDHLYVGHQWCASGDTFVQRWYAYPTGESNTYVQLALDDSTDYFELTRESAEVEGLDIQMPLVTDGITASGTVEGATLTEGGNAVYNSSETPGGELGGTWASPTIDDSIAVTSWNLTTPTITTSITTDGKTLSEAEMGLLDGGVEGTEIKSTGESGGNKYLRENGDGTCSWQTVSGGGMTSFFAEDGDGTEVEISDAKEWKFVESGGIDINWTDTSDGTDADPYDLTISLSINGLVADTLASSDEFIFYDDTGGANDKITWANLLSSVKQNLFYEFTIKPGSCILDDTSPPALTIVESTGTGTPRFRVAQFDADSDEIIYYTFVLPSDYNASGTWTMDFYWFSNDTGADEDAIWAVGVSVTTAGDADDMEEQAIDTYNTESGNVDTNEADRLIKTTVTISNKDSAVAGDIVTLVILRDADDSIGDADNDGLTSDAELVSIHVKIPRS